MAVVVKIIPIRAVGDWSVPVISLVNPGQQVMQTINHILMSTCFVLDVTGNGKLDPNPYVNFWYNVLPSGDVDLTNCY